MLEEIINAINVLEKHDVEVTGRLVTVANMDKFKEMFPQHSIDGKRHYKNAGKYTFECWEHKPADTDFWFDIL